MKPPTTVSDSFDRISTAEELQLVVSVLIDLNCAEDVEMIHAARSNDISMPELSSSWPNACANEEPTAATESAELISLFSGQHERTN